MFGCITLSGCMGWGDMFRPTRSIVGDYSLLKFDEGGHFYYLCHDGHCGGEGSGILDGAVIRIAWSDEYLVVLMGSPGASGWRIISVRSGNVEGPFSDAEFQA